MSSCDKVSSSLEDNNIEASRKDDKNKSTNKRLKTLLPGWKTVAKTLSSFLGVFILLAVYIIGGNYHNRLTIFIFKEN